jgi:hypothetical protein
MNSNPRFRSTTLVALRLKISNKGTLNLPQDAMLQITVGEIAIEHF